MAADVNADGKLDLICANLDDATLTVLTNNGNGTFTFFETLPVGQWPRSLATADVDGDGNPDLICANLLDNDLTVLLNNGDGTFSFSASLPVGAYPEAVIAADVNGDGSLDLISANLIGNSLTVLTNNGDGTFTVAATIAVGNGPVSVVAADVNADGWVDLICANALQPNSTVANTLTVLTNNGNGMFGYSATLVVGYEPASVVAADVNGDGRLDLISANYALNPNGDPGNTLTVLTNAGGGSFAFSATLTVGIQPACVLAADVNGDGWVDLICADGGNGSGNTLTVLTNNRHGAFSLSSKPSVGIGPLSIAAADLNGDGKLDLISANYGNPQTGNTLTVLLNSPAAPFLKIQLSKTNTTVLSWSAAVPGFGLQQNSVLSPANWPSATDSVTRVGGENQVSVPLATGNRFYRLFHP